MSLVPVGICILSPWLVRASSLKDIRALPSVSRLLPRSPIAYNIDAVPSVLIPPLDSQTQSSPDDLPVSLTGLPIPSFILSPFTMKKTFLKRMSSGHFSFRCLPFLSKLSCFQSFRYYSNRGNPSLPSLSQP